MTNDETKSILRQMRALGGQKIQCCQIKELEDLSDCEAVKAQNELVAAGFVTVWRAPFMGSNNYPGLMFLTANGYSASEV